MSKKSVKDFFDKLTHPVCCADGVRETVKKPADMKDDRAAGELEGRIPPAGEMSAKLTKGGRTKARLEYNKPPSGKLVNKLSR